MPRLLRLLLVCIAFALPLGGFAAARAADCAAATAARTAALSQAAADVCAAVDASSGAQGAAHGGCGGAASCAHHAGDTPALPIFDAAASDAVPLAALATRGWAFQTDAPERPPRAA